MSIFTSPRSEAFTVLLWGDRWWLAERTESIPFAHRDRAAGELVAALAGDKVVDLHAASGGALVVRSGTGAGATSALLVSSAITADANILIENANTNTASTLTVNAAINAGSANSYTPTSNASVVGACRNSSKKTSRATCGTLSNPSGGSRISPTRARIAATCSARMCACNEKAIFSSYTGSAVNRAIRI